MIRPTIRLLLHVYSLRAAMAGALAATALPALAQDGPGVPPADAPAPVVRHSSHHPRHRHRHVNAPKPPPQAQTPAPVQPPAYTEAPTPNGNLLPPQESVPANTAVLPGTMQLHYPPSGEGYVPGSSPQAMDDARTAKVPGVTLHVPLQSETPAPLPPPDEPPR